MLTKGKFIEHNTVLFILRVDFLEQCGVPVKRSYCEC